MKAKDIIKQDLERYAKAQSQTSIKTVVYKLQMMLSGAQREKFAKEQKSQYFQAWYALQVLNNTHKEYHNSKELGEFIYDDRMYRIVEIEDGPQTLRRCIYNSLCPLPLEIPDGLISLRYTFSDCVLGSQFAVSDQACTSMIEDMTCAFKNTRFVDGFTFGRNFDVSNVKSMYGMFSNAKFAKDFKLPKQFSELNGVTVENMFQDAMFGDKPLGDQNPVTVIQELTA